MNEIAWVTGARGFIGRKVAAALAASGARVHGLGHGAWVAPAASAAGVSYWINGEVDTSNLRTLAAAGQPATVFHLAGGSSVGAAIAQPHEDFRRTVNATAELLEWVRQESPVTRVVVVSSAAVYGAGHESPMGEDALLNPFSPYGAHKLIMESMCRSYGSTYGVRTAIARVFSAYGAGLRKQLLWDICSKLASGTQRLELGGDGTEVRDYVHVLDVARAIEGLSRLADASAPAFNIGTGRATPVRELALLLGGAWQAAHGSPPIELAFSGRSRAGDPRYLVADTARLRALELSCATPLERGVAEYVDWFRNRPPEAD